MTTPLGRLRPQTGIGANRVSGKSGKSERVARARDIRTSRSVILNSFSFAGLRLRIHLAEHPAADGQKWILSRRPAKLNKFRMTFVVISAV
ncbi:MAG: hypothetical protein DI555_18925 [Novosphingobium pentaromativorans]|uniref:Uncharacterized protein n=1 Tax=Novosphingobium pentaromativorans TaxID=205844 RepID=A0A2W5NH00_9SPHN|nr:MAG: hypothetical protein DI555_18925 [Novosphingobium pentaromativorans]